MVGYLSGVPAGHVTYDLVGHMLQFHKDPRLRVLWYTAHHDTQKVREGSRHEGGLKVPWQDLSSLSGKVPKDAAAEVRTRRVGVLVDLDGWIGDEPPRALMASTHGRKWPLWWLGGATAGHRGRMRPHLKARGCPTHSGGELQTTSDDHGKRRWPFSQKPPKPPSPTALDQTQASAPAPVRTQWLGWAGSTGDASCHYIVVDVALVPPRQHSYYTERLLLLPRCPQHRRKWPSW